MKSHEMWNRCRSETQRCPRRREFRRHGLLRLAHVSSDSQISYCIARTFSKLRRKRGSTDGFTASFIKFVDPTIHTVGFITVTLLYATRNPTRSLLRCDTDPPCVTITATSHPASAANLSRTPSRAV